MFDVSSLEQELKIDAKIFIQIKVEYSCVGVDDKCEKFDQILVDETYFERKAKPVRR